MDIFEKCEGIDRAMELQAQGIYPYFIPLEGSEGTEVEIGGKSLIMIGSNNYLGLTHHPDVRKAATDAIARYGTSCSGSRFLNGTLTLHEELEDRLAKFMDQEAAVCFSTGFQANLGAISAICGKRDVILCDRENHASIIDGCRLSFADTRKFRHSDTEHLEQQLQLAQQQKRAVLVIVDGLYSMMGDLAPLQDIRALADQYGARLMVDEAHGIGVLGERGRGAAEHCGIHPDLVMGTFSKSFASLGGFIAGPKKVIHHMRHNSRSLMFSASITPSSAAAALAALDLIEVQPDMRKRVLQIAQRVRTGLSAMGFRTAGTLASPIVPVIVGDQVRVMKLWKTLFECGLFTNAVTQPAVPLGADLIRTSYIASHTDEQITKVLERFAMAGKRIGLIGNAPPSESQRAANESPRDKPSDNSQVARG